MDRGWGTAGALALLACLSACGARTELEVSSEDSGSVEPVDASVDAPFERCDGMDDDGDGRIDEGLPLVDCGVGACRRTACDLALCVPGEPSVEACGGGDDDCDGMVDEGLPFGALGPAVEVREGAGGYDRCGTCSWAKDPILVPQSDGGVFVQWHHGIYGGEEIPNIWGRSLDDEGQPIAPPVPLSDLVQLGGRRIDGLEPETGLVFAIERVASDDRARVWRVGPDGLEQVEGDGAFARCSRASTLAFVDGRLVSACTSRGEASLRSRVIGESPIELELEVDEMFYGAVLHGRPDGELLLAAYHVDTDRDERWMSFARLSPTLEVLQPLTRSDATYTNADLAFPTPEGWLWWKTNWPDGVDGQRLDRSGQPIAELEPYPFRVANPPLARVSLGGGTHLVALPAGNPAGTFPLVRIGPRGELLEQTEVPIPPNPGGDPDFAAHLDLIAHGDAYWLAWIGSYAEDGEPNHVQVQRFGCTGP